MLNKILSRLNGSSADATALRQTLTELDGGRAAARTELEELQVRRHQALLDDASDATLEKLEQAIERKEALLEKFDLAEPPVRERLTAAQGAERQRLLRSLLEDFYAGAPDFLASARATAQAHAAIVEMRERLCAAGFSLEAAMLPVAPHISGAPLLAPDLLNRFETAIARARDSLIAQATPRRAKSAPPAAGKPKAAESLQHATVLWPGGVPVPDGLLFAKRPPDDWGPLRAGELRVEVLRAGYSPSDDRPQCHRGQVVRLPRVTAERAAAAGVVEILAADRAPPGAVPVSRGAPSGTHATGIDPSTGEVQRKSS